MITASPRLHASAIITLFFLCLTSIAQTPQIAQTTQSGFPPHLPAPPEKPTLPPNGPGSVDSFVQSIGKNDSAFEVLAGQGRILTTKADLSVRGKPSALIAIGDPRVIEYAVLNTRQIRIVGQRLGVTDLSITTPEGQTFSFEVRVVMDLDVVRGQLAYLFPDASIRLYQVRDHLVVEGQRRDTAQINRIMETIRAYLTSVQNQQRQANQQQGSGAAILPPTAPPVPMPPDGADLPRPVGVELARRGGGGGLGTAFVTPQVINMLRVPGSKQVLLKVRIAELNRTSFRQVGADILVKTKSFTFGTQLSNSSISGSASNVPGAGLEGMASIFSAPATSAFAIFDRADFALFFSALQKNNLLKILAEPNLVTLNGHAANFLAGGEFPVPQTVTTISGGATPNVTFKEFGVRLAFLPFILDGDVIRLNVDPEVSNLDFTIATTLVPGGSPVPGLSTRKAHTVVEMKEGQTLAIAGLMQLTLDGNTTRLPFLGNLPVLGPFFSNTNGSRTEKELIVLVTPYLVEASTCDQVPPVPGDEVNAPNNCEFYFLNRIEGRTGKDFRATTNYENKLPILRSLLKLEQDNINGPHGFTK
ncbi:MAG: pilus assembly protein N-terminal domain-containing protein [Hyphomicrobium sp.]|uniref:type II and III secretion system protein family protein n=1 Tax=Hyphomicrobium sp. TaxID=82 RepID=UPI0039E3CC22